MSTTNLPTTPNGVTTTMTLTNVESVEVHQDGPDAVSVQLAGTGGSVRIEGPTGDVYQYIITIDRQLARIVRPE